MAMVGDVANTYLKQDHFGAHGLSSVAQRRLLALLCLFVQHQGKRQREQ